jgi:hypothetical protein
LPKLHPLTVLLASYIGGLTMLTAPKLFAANCDGPWHLAAGQLILGKWAIPRLDPFSFTAGNTPWINPAWLYDALLAASVWAGGMGGGVLLTALLTALIVVLQTEHLLKRGFDFLAIIFGLTLMFAFMAPGIAMRPQMVTMLACLVCYQLLHAARNHSRMLLWLPLVFLLWSNLHGGLMLGMAVIGVFGLESILQQRWRHTLWLAITGLLCAAVSLLTPYGIELYTMIHRAMTGVMIGRISEWGSPLIGPQNWLFVGFVVLLPFLYRRAAPGVTLADELMLLGLVIAGSLSQRHIVVIGILAAPALCGMISQHLASSTTLLEISARWRQNLERETARRFLHGSALLVIVSALAGALLIRDWDSLLLPQDKYPIGEIDFLAEHYPSCRLYAYYDHGGIILHRTGGRLPLFWDGRAENVYPNAILRDGNTITDLDTGWEKLLDSHRIEVILMPQKHGIHKALQKDSAWKQIHRGKVAKVWVRKGADCLKKLPKSP